MPMRPFTATTAVAQIAAYNARRRTLSIFNNGTGTDQVILSQDQGGITANGWIVLAQQGVSFLRRDGDEPELTLYAIASAGSINVRVFEGFGDPDAATGSEP